MDLAAETAARHEDEPFAALRKLVGELQRHTAAERVSDDCARRLLQRLEKVADQVRIRPEGVIALGLSGGAMTEEIGSDDRVALAEARDDVAPHRRPAGDAVQEDDERPLARPSVFEPPPVQFDSRLLDHRGAVLQRRSQAASDRERRVSSRTCCGARASSAQPTATSASTAQMNRVQPSGCAALYRRYLQQGHARSAMTTPAPSHVFVSPYS